MKTSSTLLHFFDDSLWTASVIGARSGECSPLYADRYDGPRLNPATDSHPWWELTAVVDGGIRLGGEPVVTAEKSDCVLIAKDTLHCEETDRAETVWVGFQGTLMKGLERRLAPITVVRSPMLTEAVEQLWLVARQQGGAIGPELDALTARLVSVFLRLATEPPLTRTRHDWIEAAVAHIEGHLTEPLRLPDLARRFGCSEGHFCRIFRARTGYPPILYLLRARVTRALHLLQHTHWPVAEIGRAVGFENPFYFSRVFRRLQGCSPQQYRRTLPRNAPAAAAKR